MSQTYISMSTAALKEHGGEQAMAELKRRGDKGSRYAIAALEELGAIVNVVPVANTKVVPVPKDTKKNPKKSNALTITGANIQRTRDDNGWTWECLGVWDKDTQAVDDQHKITGHQGEGATNDEAKAAFFAPFRELGIYLARPYYNDVKDYRVNPLATEMQRSSNTGDIQAAMDAGDREAMKAHLGLSTSDSKHIDTLILLCTKSLKAAVVAKPSDEYSVSIANLLERFGK